jgi:hypothetical protein
MWKEAVVAYFEVLSQHLPGGIEEKHKHLSQKSQFKCGTSQVQSRSANNWNMTSGITTQALKTPASYSGKKNKLSLCLIKHHAMKMYTYVQFNTML